MIIINIKIVIAYNANQYDNLHYIYYQCIYRFEYQLSHLFILVVKTTHSIKRKLAKMEYAFRASLNEESDVSSHCHSTYFHILRHIV
jgi:hypothetical protein